MGQVLGLKFRDHGQIYYFDSGPFVVKPGDHVIVKTEQGMGLGHVSTVRDDVPEELADRELKNIFRLATEEDLKAREENVELAAAARKYCRSCIEERKLEMKLVDVEVYFDRSKVIFYFTAPGRIDFRELVKDLVREYRTRIELRQIGVRHETQMLGAVGNCGQVACCKRFMRKFEPVTIKMAKEQNLFLNPTKISGICGRLLCCLSFEEENYERFYRQCPKMGKRLQTSKGIFKVLRANFFRNSLSLLTDRGEEVEMDLDEWHESRPRPVDFQVQQSSHEPRDEKPEPDEPPEAGGSQAVEDDSAVDSSEAEARAPEHPRESGTGEEAAKEAAEDATDTGKQPGSRNRKPGGGSRPKGSKFKKKPRKKPKKGKGGKGK
jgi:cell fate regulator YaaT (PSP1 superfamily)